MPIITMGRPGGDGAGEPGGLVLYTSLMLILVSFFVMLVAKNDFDETKYAAALASLQVRFGDLPGGRLAMGAEWGLPDVTVGAEEAGEIALPETGMARLRAHLAPAVLAKEARVIHTRDGRLVSLSTGYAFKKDSWEVSDEMAGFLTELAAIALELGFPITVEGHTDNHPPQTGGIIDNWDISAKRAEAVRAFLVARGLPPGSVAAYGYAGTRPLYSNMSPQSRLRNNRVDLALAYDFVDKKALKRWGGEATTFQFRGFDFLFKEKRP